MLFILADLPMQKSRMKTIKNLLEAPDFPELDQALQKLENRIQWDKIYLTFNEMQTNPKILVEEVPPKGRYTVKGENGGGKSSLLLLIKMLNKREAFYLPVKHDLSFQVSKEGFSTGQLARKTLNELLEHLEAPIVLLDEWDAILQSA